MALAACGSSGPGGGSGGGTGEATYWYLTGEPGEGIRTNAVNRFNKENSDSQIKPTAFENDAYKTKIRTAIGAGQAPTIIWGWGGGGLKSWVDAGQVDDLTDWFAQNAAVKDRLFPSSFGAATVNGKIYAMPCETVEPIVLFYDKRAFDKIKAEPPQSWGEIMALVPKFNAQGIAPFSLAGQSRWTNMMWRSCSTASAARRCSRPSSTARRTRGRTRPPSTRSPRPSNSSGPTGSSRASTPSSPTPTPTRPCSTPARPR
jgi:raffinose/stachyose/melibiose transport system substrate-binding protein